MARNAEGPGRFPGRGLQVPGEALAEDMRFELVRGCPPHAFQMFVWPSARGRTRPDLRRCDVRAVLRMVVDGHE